MKISTKGRYALRVMIDLAEHDDGGYTAMKEVAERQGVSLKYMERILPVLVGGGLIKGVHGKGGGYKLTRKPEEYPIGEILRLTEGSLVPVACMEPGAEPCGRTIECRTYPLWHELTVLIDQFLDRKTIADLMKHE